MLCSCGVGVVFVVNAVAFIAVAVFVAVAFIDVAVFVVVFVADAVAFVSSVSFIVVVGMIVVVVVAIAVVVPHVGKIGIDRAVWRGRAGACGRAADSFLPSCPVTLSFEPGPSICISFIHSSLHFRFRLAAALLGDLGVVLFSKILFFFYKWFACFFFNVLFGFETFCLVLKRLD